MRPDQLVKLAALAERLIDIVLIEGDPNNWTAAGQLPREMTKQDRGDRYWCIKSAAMVKADADRILMMLGRSGVGPYARNEGVHLAGGSASADDGGDIEGIISAAERRAQRMLEGMKPH